MRKLTTLILVAMGLLAGFAVGSQPNSSNYCPPCPACPGGAMTTPTAAPATMMTTETAGGSTMHADKNNCCEPGCCSGK